MYQSEIWLPFLKPLCYAALTRDAGVLTEYKTGFGTFNNRKYFEGNKSTVITLDPELEQALLNAVQKTENGSYVALN